MMVIYALTKSDLTIKIDTGIFKFITAVTLECQSLPLTFILQSINQTAS